MIFSVTFSAPSEGDADYYYVSASQVVRINRIDPDEDLVDVATNSLTFGTFNFSPDQILHFLGKISFDHPNEPIAIELERKIINYENIEDDVLLHVQIEQESESFKGKSCRLVLFEINEDGSRNIATNGMSIGIREFDVKDQRDVWSLLFDEKLTRDGVFDFFEFGASR